MIVLSCILDLVSGERQSWRDPEDDPRFELTDYALLIRRDSVTRKRNGDLEVYPWHAVLRFTCDRKPLPRPKRAESA